MTGIAHYDGTSYHVNGRGRIIGTSEAMLSLFWYLNRLADLSAPVLVLGESGVGKELVSKALHYNRGNGSEKGPFVAVNCAGIPSELL